MKAEEFNKKYQQYIEEGFGGLSIDIPKAVNYLDEIFPNLIDKYPNLQFSQIKAKFDKARVYMDNVPRPVIEDIQTKLNFFIDEYYTGRSQRNNR